MILNLFSSFLLSLPLHFFSSFIFSFVCMCRHLYISFTVTPHTLYNHQYYSSLSVATIFNLLLVILKLFNLLWKTFDFIENAIFHLIRNSHTSFYFMLYYHILFFIIFIFFLFYFILFYFILFYFILFYILFYFILFYFI